MGLNASRLLAINILKGMCGGGVRIFTLENLVSLTKFLRESPVRIVRVPNGPWPIVVGRSH